MAPDLNPSMLKSTQCQKWVSFMKKKFVNMKIFRTYLSQMSSGSTYI